jgi:hypothetical protein
MIAQSSKSADFNYSGRSSFSSSCSIRANPSRDAVVFAISENINLGAPERFGHVNRFHLIEILPKENHQKKALLEVADFLLVLGWTKSPHDLDSLEDHPFLPAAINEVDGLRPWNDNSPPSLPSLPPSPPSLPPTICNIFKLF